MREIKFRAWDPKRKRLFSIPVKDMMWGYENLPDNFPGTWSIMQFTGLTDKTGKEIYEGDVVRFYYTCDDILAVTKSHPSKPTEMIDEVKFTEGAFFFVNKDVGDGAYARRWNDRCEVIGNIYENPGLLKGEMK